MLRIEATTGKKMFAFTTNRFQAILFNFQACINIDMHGLNLAKIEKKCTYQLLVVCVLIEFNFIEIRSDE